MKKEFICDKIIKNVFLDSCDLSTSVWEKSQDGTYYNRIYTIYFFDTEDVIILWTKIVVPSKDKINLYKDVFYYLYDIDNCFYKTVPFSDIKDFTKKLSSLREKNKFGKELLNISKFIQTPLEIINSSLYKKGMTWISVLNVDYISKWKSLPCKNFTADFLISLSSQINFKLNIRKTNNDLWLFHYFNDSFSKKRIVESLDDIGDEISDFIIDEIKLE